MPNVPSVLISFLALFVSLAALRYNRSKDALARTQSVNDDYWLRKVVSPNSIEPFLAFGTDLSTELPPTDSGAVDEAAVFKAQRQRLGNLAMAFGNLAVVDPSLEVEVGQLVERYEDRLVAYQFAREQFVKGAGPEPSRPEALAELAGIQHDVVRCIKNHQVVTLAVVPAVGRFRHLWNKVGGQIRR